MLTLSYETSIHDDLKFRRSEKQYVESDCGIIMADAQKSLLQFSIDQKSCD